jgi:hypothetical protein
MARLAFEKAHADQMAHFVVAGWTLPMLAWPAPAFQGGDLIFRTTGSIIELLFKAPRSRNTQNARRQHG